MRIAIDCRMKYGVGTILRNIVPLLIQYIDHIYLLGHKNELFSWGLNSNRITIIPFAAKIYSLNEQLTFPSYILKNIDILHIPHYNIPLLTSNRRAKLVVTVNDLIHLSQYFPINSFKKRYAKFMIKYALKKANHVIALSEYTKNDILKKYYGTNSEKITVSYCGVDNKVFYPRDYNEWILIKQKYSLPDKFILTVGSQRPHKNFKTVVSSFLAMKEAGISDYNLIIVGESKGFRTNENEKNNTDAKIQYLGYVDTNELAILYSFCSLFIFLSLFEGFGLPPLEAMACGAPVVVSNTTSLPEVIGDSGLQVDPFNQGEIVEKMSSILTNYDLRCKYTVASIARAKNFNWESTVNDYLKIYHKCLIN